MQRQSRKTLIGSNIFLKTDILTVFRLLQVFFVLNVSINADRMRGYAYTNQIAPIVVVMKIIILKENPKFTRFQYKHN